MYMMNYNDEKITFDKFTSFLTLPFLDHCIYTRKAVQQLSSGKAPGADAIPAEVYKAGGLPMAEKLTELFHCMWRKEAIPQEFKDASIIHPWQRN